MLLSLKGAKEVAWKTAEGPYLSVRLDSIWLESHHQIICDSEDLLACNFQIEHLIRQRCYPHIPTTQSCRPLQFDTTVLVLPHVKPSNSLLTVLHGSQFFPVLSVSSS